MRDLFGKTSRAILFHLNAAEFADATRIMRRMFELHESRATSAERGDLRAQFAILLCLFAQSFSLHHRADSVPGRLERTLEYINSHYRENPTLADLARLSSFSVSQFVRTFRREYGITPIAYLRELRTTEAARLLRHTPLSIREIGRMVGIEDPAYFCRIFRRVHRASPREFRKKFQPD